MLKLLTQSQDTRFPVKLPTVYYCNKLFLELTPTGALHKGQIIR